MDGSYSRTKDWVAHRDSFQCPKASSRDVSQSLIFLLDARRSQQTVLRA